MGERTFNIGSEVDAENENKEPVSGNPLGELATPTKREFLVWTLKWMQKKKMRSQFPEISCGELAPPNNKSTVGERTYNLGSEGDAEHEDKISA